jgi:hypothetical protein
MKNFLLLLNYLTKSYDLLLNLLLHQVLLLLLNHMRMLGVSIEEDGDIMVEVEEDTVAEDIEVAPGEVLMEVLGVVTTVVAGEDITVIRVKKDRLEVLRKVMAVLMEEEENGEITDTMVIRVKKDRLEVLRKVMAVLMVEEEENGEITLRNLKNKRCVLLLKSK